MEVPEKIFLFRNRLGVLIDSFYLEPSKVLDNIEYIRKDAFVEKATIWLNKCFITHDEYGVISTQFDTEEEMFEDFKNYMKEE